MKQRQSVMAFNNNTGTGGESDCLIKTKHCDGWRPVRTQCDLTSLHLFIIGICMLLLLDAYFSLLHTAPCLSCLILAFVCLVSWHCYPYILLNFNENAFTFVPLLHHCKLLASAGMHKPHPLCCSLSHETTCAY